MTEPRVFTVLLVADSPRDAERVRVLLAGAGGTHRFELTRVADLAEARERLREEHFDVALLELGPPDELAADVVAQLRFAAATLPIVALVDAEHEPLALQAVRAGAQDYLLKGRIDSYLVSRAIRYAVERKAVEERLQQLAQYDPVTGLPNRSLFRDHLRATLARADRGDQFVALLIVGLDRFKAINETLGHDAGDQLLRTASDRLRACLRTSDMVGRVDGDKFAVVVEGIRRVQDPEAEAPWPEASVARRFLTSLASAFQVASREIFVTASIGIALYPRDGRDATELLRNADTALRHAKEQGGSTYRFYTSAMNAQVVERLALESSLRRALAREEFVLYYQPQVDLRTGRIIGAEALLRWRDPERGMVSPGEFIPVAEESGLIVPIGEWVLRTACDQNRGWQAIGLPPLRVSVNVSGYQFRQSALTHTVARTLKASGLDPRFLELEMTESVLMQNTQVSKATLGQLKAMDLRLVIDDFGTGYSSLSYLKRFPVDALKIDRSFVADISTDPDAAAIVRAIIALAHSLRLEVVAEGTETEEQLTFLRTHVCDSTQGYLFCPPLPPQEFVALLRDDRPLGRPHWFK